MHTLHHPFSPSPTPVGNRSANSKTGLLSLIFRKTPSPTPAPRTTIAWKLGIGDAVSITDPDHGHCHRKAHIVEDNGTTLVVCDRHHRKFTVDRQTASPLLSSVPASAQDQPPAGTP